MRRRAPGHPEQRPRPPGRRALAEFFAAGLLTVLLVGVGGVLASREAGEDEAVNDVRLLTETLASTIVSPVVSDALLAGDPEALAALDDALAVPLAESSLTRVKLWTADGRIVYSDDRRLVGSVYELDAEHLAALTSGGVVAEVSTLDGPENRFEKDQVELLEVYTPVPDPRGDQLLFEAYYESASVNEAGARIWHTIVPIVLGCLLLTEAVHLGLAGRLARRLRASQAERERLLQHAIGSSDAERRRIAADLHDGVVQDLAGLSFELRAAAGRVPPGADESFARSLDAASVGARRSVQALRTLMVDIYPPNLEQRGLEAALADLLEPLSVKGIQTGLVVDPEPELSSEVRKAVYRTAQEAVRNATKHGAPQAVTISVRRDDRQLVTEVADDGRGFDAASPAAGRGHLGLALLRDLAASVRGQVAIESSPGLGTTVTMRVPA